MTLLSFSLLTASCAAAIMCFAMWHHRHNLQRTRKAGRRCVQIPNDKLIPYIAADVRSGHTVTFTVRGYSMRPFIEHERDKVVLAPIDSPLRRGDVILAEIAPKRYAMHRIIKLSAESITMQGDGNPWQTETFPPSAIIGRAKAFYRKGSDKPVSVESLTWRIYSRLWMAFKPVRRYLLALHRRLWLPLFPPV